MKAKYLTSIDSLAFCYKRKRKIKAYCISYVLFYELLYYQKISRSPLILGWQLKG
jgi:hypothetical protein